VKLIAAVAAAVSIFSAEAQAQPPRCIPPQAGGQMVTSLLPTVIDSLARQCGAHLPAGAFLGDRSHALAERMRAETAAIRGPAVAAILEMTGQDPARPGQDPEQLIGVLADGIAGDVNPTRCRGASELIEALAPLPTANFAQAFGAVLAIVAAETGEDGPPICRG
jgi:hypothetical protein